MFEDRPPKYDQKKYYEDLKKQAEEQKLKKKQLEYMSEEEYKFNRNQLNVIIQWW